MANSWRKHTVYPPRYFAGHITVKRDARPVRVEFFNAPIIPISPKEARIFCGAPDSCFYDEGIAEFANLHGAVLVDIQYAISVYDAARKGYEVEKFNHPFSKKTVILYRGDYLSIVRPDGGDIYGVYDVNEVLDNVTACDVPVTQFIS